MKTLFSKNIPNQEATIRAAQEIGEILRNAGNFSLFLEGGLGAGKTFIVREILRNLGVTQEITSPTYTYVNEYETGEGDRFAHFDFYRFTDPADFFGKGFQDIAEDMDTNCFSEWPEKISEEAKSCFSGKKFMVRLSFGVGVGMRKIKFIEG